MEHAKSWRSSCLLWKVASQLTVYSNLDATKHCIEHVHVVHRDVPRLAKLLTSVTKYLDQAKQPFLSRLGIRRREQALLCIHSFSYSLTLVMPSLRLTCVTDKTINAGKVRSGRH